MFVGGIPGEVDLWGVYVPPLLIAGLLGLFAAWLVSRALNRFRLSRYFFYPPLVFVSLVVLFTVLFATFVVPV